MSRKKMPEPQEAVITKLVHGGQGLGELADGRKVFVWNALPGERVLVQFSKSKKQYAEGVAIEVIEPSSERITPKDEAYLSTSPWQIMSFDAENRYKREILTETFTREHVSFDPEQVTFYGGDEQLYYRNKMEYSFWGDDDGLHLALFHRASHGKRIIDGSSIAMPAVDQTARKVRDTLNTHGVRGSSLKTVIIRADQAGKCVAALFVKDEDFDVPQELSAAAQGVVVYFSNPKSPASVPTRELWRSGSTVLTDTVLGASMQYDVLSFFQVHLPVFEQAARAMKDAAEGASTIIDMYAGVGTIGLIVGAETFIELDDSNIALLEQNTKDSSAEVIAAPSEQALEYITSGETVIFDPPRSGLHQTVIDRVLEAKPPKIIYLSCNPITQARDIALLQTAYEIENIHGYNFFPRTPHIESLVILKLIQ